MFPAQVECRRNRFCHSRDGGKFISFPVKIGRLRERRGAEVGDGTDGLHKTHTRPRSVGGNEVKQRGGEGRKRREWLVGRLVGR